jgi:hypothetical protein
LVELRGDKSRSKRSAPTPPSIKKRVDLIVSALWHTSSAPTRTQLDAYAFAGDAFGVVLERLRGLIEERLEEIEAALEAAGAPWTPGRVPHWGME